MTDENRTLEDELDESELDKIKDNFKEEPEHVSLNINRVPKYVSDELKDVANEMFAGDYGIALTYWKLQKDRVEELEETVNDIHRRIGRLEAVVEDMRETKDKQDGLNTIG